MLDDDQVIRLLDAGTVVSADGRRLGRVGQLFRGDGDGEFTWVSVDTGPGETGRQRLVPMAGSSVEGNELRVAYPADAIGGAPQVAVGASVSERDEQQVRAFYGLDSAAASARPAAEQVASVVRSEERLNIDTQWVPVRRARLEKFEVTETRTIEVPWTREDVRVVYEPVAGGSEVAAAPAAPRPWVLREERIVVTKEWFPAQTVRLVVERVSGEQQVSAAVRKEQVTVDGVDGPTGSAGTVEASSGSADTVGTVEHDGARQSASAVARD